MCWTKEPVFARRTSAMALLEESASITPTNTAEPLSIDTVSPTANAEALNEKRLLWWRGLANGSKESNGSEKEDEALFWEGGFEGVSWCCPRGDLEPERGDAAAHVSQPTEPLDTVVAADGKALGGCLVGLSQVMPAAERPSEG